jgi:glycosyltransferase involved in cell wall biosynthesis
MFRDIRKINLPDHRMSNAKKLCLNMIVKNEMANLERCLSAVADHIDCWVIGDTGSTDGTQDFIRSFFAARNIPGELHSFPFHNFERARNAALDCAYASPIAYDYLLFDDADMELVVEDRDFRTKLTAPSYTVLQRASISYWNTRVVRRDAGARYRGVTHEYVDVPGGDREQLHGIWYKDHASGSNRVDKFERDIRLLREALKKEPDSSRYWFYLAQSYRDAGKIEKAAETYAKRAAMGGWDEEAWYARLQQARCLRKLGDDGGFLREALAAFNQRPQRAEPLYDLARYYRDKGSNHTSALFAEAGLAMERPSDILFLEDFVYTTGFKEEYSISANYSGDSARKDRGFAACNWLALNKSISESSRNLAVSNLHFYVEQAVKMLPSFAARPVGFAAPDGYRPTNPSVARHGDEIVLVQRTVNYTIDESFLDGDDRRYATPNGAPIHTRNFLLRLDTNLEIQSSAEILPPAGMPEPLWPQVRGFEDMRPFRWRDELWCIACFRELTPEGWCELALARIDEGEPGACRLTDWRVLHPEGPRLHEKNWMPRVDGDRLQFIYKCDPTRLVNEQARTVSEVPALIAADQFRGGSQAIHFDGGWLALIHEARVMTNKQRVYRHRFVWLDETDKLRGVSRPFYFQIKSIEFAAGLAWHPDGKRLLISYGVGDQEAWIATVDAGDIRRVLDDAENLPSGAPGSERQVPFTAVTGAGARADALPAEAQRGGNVEKKPKLESNGIAKSTQEFFLDLAPFLRSADSPEQRREQSRAFDTRIAPSLSRADGAMLPQIHCFYEVLSDKAEHKTLIAATTSMRATGHPVRVWSYTPQKLEFLKPHGIEIRAADDVVPRSLFDRIVARSEIRYFSDVFRYAVLYEHGGLWMDSDVVMLRPFPFRGEYFFNLQWRTGTKPEHYICGNVMYAEPFSHHLRALYETAIDRALESRGWEFGIVGPKLLSNYIASEAGAALRDWVFSPMLFNPIDWTEIDRFDKPISELTEYLDDDRTFGIHLWTARNAARAHGNNAPLVSLLTDPLVSFPTFTNLADRFNTDKNRHTGNRHCYARVYDRLLSDRRFSLRRLMEIGLCRGLAERNQTETPSVTLWQSYFPYCQVTGVDLTDFSALNNERFASFVCDQSKRDDLRAVAAKLEPGSFDVIIDDGSHASFDEQLTLCEFFPLLADGGWYFLEDLDWQPPGEDPSKITLTKNLLREIQQHGSARSIDPLGVSRLAEQIEEILFFDSHYELARAKLMGGLVAVRKRGGSGFVR